MRYLIWLLALALAGCTMLPPAATIPAGDASPTAAPAAVWQPLFPGVDLLITGGDLTALRHDPAAVLYQSRFDPALAGGKSVGGWLQEDATAFAAVNCGFYYDNNGRYEHIGLLMTAGQQLSSLRADWGGVAIVREGVAFVARRPARLLAPAALGIQGWPMLVDESQVVPQLDATEIARRTGVGVDAAGRVVWVVTPFGMTLDEFARQLLAPDLALTAAVNLDGGASTGLRWRSAPGAALTGPESLPVPCAVLLAPAAE